MQINNIELNSKVEKLEAKNISYENKLRLFGQEVLFN